jgi:hypothetical protein
MTDKRSDWERLGDAIRELEAALIAEMCRTLEYMVAQLAKLLRRES